MRLLLQAVPPVHSSSAISAAVLPIGAAAAAVPTCTLWHRCSADQPTPVIVAGTFTLLTTTVNVMADMWPHIPRGELIDSTEQLNRAKAAKDHQRVLLAEGPTTLMAVLGHLVAGLAKAPVGWATAACAMLDSGLLDALTRYSVALPGCQVSCTKQARCC